jgi:hypothetical protein
MSEHCRTELVVNDDPRLVSAIASVVEYASHRAGLSEAAQKQLEAAAEDACREAFPLVNGRERALKFCVQDFDDRVEVMIEHAGGKSAATTPAISAKVASRVDSVRQESHGKVHRVILTKYVRPAGR